MHRDRLLVTCSGALLLSSAVAAAPPTPAPSCTLHAATHRAMGTEFSVRVCAQSGAAAAALHAAAFAEIDAVDERLSNHLASSELSRLNREAGSGWVAASPETLAFLRAGRELARRSGGAFDMTVGPLMKAWRFYRGSGRLPGASELEAARERVGFRLVELDGRRGVRFARAGVELDPGGIGKGYALDRAAARLRELGVRSALLDAGSSSLVAIGAPPGARGWNVRVPDPDVPARTLSVVALRDASLSTSGRREKCFVLGGVTYSHIIDPRTGWAVQGVVQTTVIAPGGALSDALSTAVFVLGPRHAPRFLSSIRQAKALLVTDDRPGGRVVRWKWPDAGDSP